jgi:hypothetical protein
MPHSDGSDALIKHIVMWKLKEFAEGSGREENGRRMKSLLDSCRGLTPGMIRLEVAVAQSGLEATADVVLYSEFADKAALDAYQSHPQHMAAKPFIGAVREWRQCVDYQI